MRIKLTEIWKSETLYQFERSINIFIYLEII